MRNILLTSVMAAGLAFASVAQAADFTASNAKLSGKELIVDVTSPGSGWAVIHKVKNGKPGDHVGHAKIKKDKNSNVKIELSEMPQVGKPLIVMLHDDEGEKGKFEFKSEQKIDLPATNKKGKILMVKVTPKS